MPIGCRSGSGPGSAIVPWIAIAIQLARGQAETGSVPGFVYGIFFSLLVLFALFAVNMWLQYRQVGRWRDYLYGENAATSSLSLTAKSALAWQVYAGALGGLICSAPFLCFSREVRAPHSELAVAADDKAEPGVAPSTDPT